MIYFVLIMSFHLFYSLLIMHLIISESLFVSSDIGFEVGGDTGIDYLVLQVHYAHVDKFEGKYSGERERGRG